MVADSVNGPRRVLLWVSGAWVLPFWGIALWLDAGSVPRIAALSICAILLAPLPALMFLRWQRARLLGRITDAEEAAAQLKLQLETVRFRTARLREELQAADQQARLSHQLTLLGQFTAGFMHEFNNPLAIVAGRLEVLLEERKDDSALCADLEQMLKETRYMGQHRRHALAGLAERARGRSLRCVRPKASALHEAMAAFSSDGKVSGMFRCWKKSRRRRAWMCPEHVIGEVVRGLLSNALEALEGSDEGNDLGAAGAVSHRGRQGGASHRRQWSRRSRGDPRASVRTVHFAEQRAASAWAWACFWPPACWICMMAASGTKTRDGGGASFVIELPPARFTRGQPYHWFAGGTSQ